MSRGKIDQRISPTNFLVIACFGMNHMRLHSGRMSIEDIQNVPIASEFIQPSQSYLVIEACFKNAKNGLFNLKAKKRSK
jgi:hypothetical protein